MTPRFPDEEANRSQFLLVSESLWVRHGPTYCFTHTHAHIESSQGPSRKTTIISLPLQIGKPRHGVVQEHGPVCEGGCGGSPWPSLPPPRAPKDMEQDRPLPEVEVRPDSGPCSEGASFRGCPRVTQEWLPGPPEGQGWDSQQRGSARAETSRKWHAGDNTHGAVWKEGDGVQCRTRHRKHRPGRPQPLSPEGHEPHPLSPAPLLPGVRPDSEWLPCPATLLQQTLPTPCLLQNVSLPREGELKFSKMTVGTGADW